MEYLKPIANLQSTVGHYRTVICLLCGFLALTIIGVPLSLRGGPFVIIDDDGFSKIVRSKPWEITVSRAEGFLKYYLSTRFEWDTANFSEKSKHLKEITTDSVYSRLKDSISSFQSVAQAQKAKSYLVLEGFAFSNKEHKIEARITRVLRIDQAAVATPLVVRFSYSETALSESNPYGIVVDAVSELSPAEDTPQGGSQ